MDMTHESQSHSRQKLQMTVGDFTTQWRIEGKGVVFQSTKCKMLVNLNSLVCVLFLFVLNILKCMDCITSYPISALGKMLQIVTVL